MSKDKILPLVAGNWKMNGTRASLAELGSLRERLDRRRGCAVAVCPPFTLLAPAAERLAGSGIELGAQNCHIEPSGPHTGDVSAEMLAELGCRYVIVGHSERRADHGESDALVRGKAQAAHRAGLCAIVCVGETQAERDAGETLRVVGRQLAGSLPDELLPENTIVAYEPVWAIGTGRTPAPEDVADIHGAIRVALRQRFAGGERIRLLYGGSVTPANAGTLLAMDNVDGALVGGASLKADSFAGIIDACH